MVRSLKFVQEKSAIFVFSLHAILPGCVIDHQNAYVRVKFKIGSR